MAGPNGLRLMLAVRDLWVAPAGAPDAVVRGVSFDVRPGEWLVVTGSNGCGKTTLALAAAGLLEPSRGTARWGGFPSADRSPRSGSGPILAVMQDPASQLLQPTVEEELRYTADNIGRDPSITGREVSRLSARLGLDGLMGQDPATLSAGGQQLVLIAAALAARPGLLVADEPCAHLDPGARDRVLALVAEEVASGLAVLWVTQGEEERAAGTRALDMDPVSLDGCVAPEPGVEGPVTLVLEVDPEADPAGPRVRTGEALRIEVHGPGLLVLEGPNGAGKSVLLAAACGVSPCRQVRVTCSGTEPPPLLAGQYPEMQVFQERVDDELAYAAVARGVSRERALSDAAILLRRLRMDPDRLLGMNAWDLSTGERRLVELVATLIAPAGLVALDEPTGGLDPERRRVLASLVRGRAGDSAVLVASQDHEWIRCLGARRFHIGNRLRVASIGEKSD